VSSNPLCLENSLIPKNAKTLYLAFQFFVMTLIFTRYLDFNNISVLPENLITVISCALSYLGMYDLYSKLELVITDPTSRPPENPLYAKQVRGFTVSKIFSFNGMPWQMRSIKIKGKWFILPFIIDTGGPQSRFPIISDPVLKKFHLFRTSSNIPEIIGIPSPFGYSQAPLTGTWGDSRSSIIQKTDMKFNAFGRDEARSIVVLETLTYHWPNASIDEILQILVNEFGNSIDSNVARQEIQALRKNAALNEWSDSKLPIVQESFQV
jgi:hypothetical protein